MRKTDLNTIMLFITRTGMFIGKQSQDSIISFITGYEMGTKGKCNLTYSISELLSSHYKCKKMATGWPGQIREFSIKNKVNWIVGFKKTTLIYFYRTQDFSIESEFKEALKSRIESKINQIELDWVALGFEDWSNEWIGLVNLNEKKFQIIWTKKELEILLKLDNEINQIRENKNPLMTKLINLKNEYEKTRGLV